MAQENEQTTIGGMVSNLIAAVTPGSSEEAKAPEETGGVTDLTAMQNPVTEYPKSSFDKQPQSVPGLAGEMHPRPDHGEKSYKGHGRLAGRKALVTGGDSGIGRAAVIAFAREGADVAVNYLPEEEADAQEVLALMRAEGRKAVALPGDIKSETFCQQLVADAVRELGGLDIVVNNAGKQHAVNSILDLTTEQLDATFKTNLYALVAVCSRRLPPAASRFLSASR